MRSRSRVSYAFHMIVTALLASAASAGPADPVSTEHEVVYDPHAGVWLEDGFVPFVFPDALALANPDDAVSGSFSQSAGGRAHSRRWRRVGTIVGGVGAFLLYAPRAVSDSRIGVSDAQRVTEWSAVTIGGALTGYFIGRTLDESP